MEEEMTFIRDNYQFMTTISLGKMLGIHANTVRRYMKKLGIVPDKDVVVHNRRELLKEMWGETLFTTKEAAEEFGVTINAIQHDLEELGLPSAKELYDQRKIAQALPFIEDGASPRDIMETIGVGVSWFSRNFPDYRWSQQQYASFHRYRRKLEAVTSL